MALANAFLAGIHGGNALSRAAGGMLAGIDSARQDTLAKAQIEQGKQQTLNLQQMNEINKIRLEAEKRNDEFNRKMMALAFPQLMEDDSDAKKIQRITGQTGASPHAAAAAALRAVGSDESGVPPNVSDIPQARAGDGFRFQQFPTETAGLLGESIAGASEGIPNAIRGAFGGVSGAASALGDVLFGGGGAIPQPAAFANMDPTDPTLEELAQDDAMAVRDLILEMGGPNVFLSGDGGELKRDPFSAGFSQAVGELPPGFSPDTSNFPTPAEISEEQFRRLFGLTGKRPGTIGIPTPNDISLEQFMRLFDVQER